MNSLVRLATRPWLHFLVLGCVLLQLRGMIFPTPKTIIGPISERRVQSLSDQWRASVGRSPSPEQKKSLLVAELDRDMLFQRALDEGLHHRDGVVYQRLLRNMDFLELADDQSDKALHRQAIRMRLHLGDEVIKRRLIQRMQQSLLAANRPSPPTEAAVLRAFNDRKADLRKPALYSIQHIYFPRDRREDQEVFESQIDWTSLDANQALQYGFPFLSGYRFVDHTLAQLAGQFGTQFVEQLRADSATKNVWLGPLESTFGMHYVWLENFQPERDARLPEVRQSLINDLQKQANIAALRTSVNQLRRSYEIVR